MNKHERPTKDEDREDGFSDTLHARARDSAVELHKLFLSLSTAMVGLYFVIVTQEVEPALSAYQKRCIVFAVTAAGLAVVLGIISTFADAKRHYYWARSLQTSSKNRRSMLWGWRTFWLRIMRIAGNSMVFCFAAGVAASAVYIVMRLWSV